MQILGIDVGGSGIKGAIVDTEKGELITERFRLVTPQPATPDAMIETMIAIIRHFDWHGPIGCGFPAAVVNEIIRTAANIDNSWIGVNASKRIEKETGCPVHLVNDVDAAAYAEMNFGAGVGEHGTVVMAAFGTGIGTAIFRNDQLIPNTEFGHVYLKNGKKAEHYSANSVREKNEMSWKKWGKRVNKYLQYMEALFWPDLFIIGGGVSKDFDSFKEYIDVEARVVPAASRNHAGIIGAALSAKDFAIS
ncbi:MAG: ROK family protein [Balneola sp.]|nr:MAG: ROK family protein [Balneola sp.]